MTVAAKDEEEATESSPSFKLHSNPRLLAKAETPELFKQAQWYVLSCSLAH
jgi:hypothetical protein